MVAKTHETDLGYPSLMLAQSELLGDVVDTDYGYDWWWPFNASLQMYDNGYYSYLPTLLYISLLNRPMT